MTFRDFLDASYALLIEGYTSVAANRIDLLSAIEKVESGIVRERQSAPKVVASQNDQAMAQLTALMAGVKR